MQADWTLGSPAISTRCTPTEDVGPWTKRAGGSGASKMKLMLRRSEIHNLPEWNVEVHRWSLDAKML